MRKLAESDYYVCHFKPIHHPANPCLQHETCDHYCPLLLVSPSALSQMINQLIYFFDVMFTACARKARKL